MTKTDNVNIQGPELLYGFQGQPGVTGNRCRRWTQPPKPVLKRIAYDQDLLGWQIQADGAIRMAWGMDYSDLLFRGQKVTVLQLVVNFHRPSIKLSEEWASYGGKKGSTIRAWDWFHASYDTALLAVDGHLG